LNVFGNARAERLFNPMLRSFMMRRWLFALLLSVNVFAPVVALAQDYPTRGSRLIVPFPPGGATDIAARVVAEHLSKVWPHPVAVENRSGASGIIGTDAVARAAPDGYTLLLGTLATNVMAHLLRDKVPYTPDSFAPVIVLTSSPNILLANASVPFKSLAELIEFAKRNPGKLKYGSSGIGLSGHLGLALFGVAANIDLVHVPYRGSAPSVQAFAAGEVELTLGLIPQAISAIRNTPGVRAIAIASARRSSQFPDTPTFAELGYSDVQVYAINGLMVPAGTPRPIIDKIYRDSLKALDQPEIRDRFEKLGMDVSGASPEEFARLLAAERARWEPLIRRNNIREQ
jgi:tripartite-type tricarboxylate transporter receptor subunit TctC